MRRFSLCALVAILATVPSLRAQATLASLNGTYTFVLTSLHDYSPMYNMSGQQVGFCNNNQTPVGYNCGYTISSDWITGTLVANGAGKITSGAFTQTSDPNSYECSPKSNPTSPCPVKVPSGASYSAAQAYKVGAVVDYMVSGTTRTFQAVRASTGKPPNWTVSSDNPYICSYSTNNFNTCYWTQIPASLTSGNTSSINATLTGTYTISANGSGTMTLTLTQVGCTGSNCSETGEFAIVVSPTSAVGQNVHISGESVLGNRNRSVGGASRIK